MEKILLASQSHRRHYLLQMIGVPFDIVVPKADEKYDPALPPEAIVCHISRKKAEAARALVEEERLIVAADTMVFLDGLRLGKPRDAADAKTMLQALADRTHIVRTGVTVCRGQRVESRAETTHVTFRPLTETEIDAYIATGEPMDKAGAYGVQGRAALFVRRICGDFFNVMGLPLYLLGEMLRGFGVSL